MVQKMGQKSNSEVQFCDPSSVQCCQMPSDNKVNGRWWCVCVQIRFDQTLQRKLQTTYIYSCEMSHIRHLHSSAETCDFAVSSNSCCCESHNKIKWWRALPKLHLQWKMGVAMQWTMPKVIFLNGVNDAPFFF
jgi:hypothetical protein